MNLSPYGANHNMKPSTSPQPMEPHLHPAFKTRRLLLICGLAAASIPPALRAQQPIPDPIAPQRRQGTAVRIELVGDSTLSPNFGYGTGFCANILPAADCVDMAKGGTSSKTYRQGVWAKALESKPDYMIIQFGHNDVPTPGHMDRETTMDEYVANMKAFVQDARAAGITPVLVTPLSRRIFGPDGKIHSDLEPYATTIRSIASQMQVPLIDLHAESVAYLNKLGPDAQRIVSGRTRKTPAGEVVPDKTHLNVFGGYTFGRMVAVDLAKAVPALEKDVRTEPVPIPTSNP
jgi:lysophospholipase L1-like esterase